MSAGCDEIQARLTDAFLAREEAAVGDVRHADGCDACGALQTELAALAEGFAAAPEPALRDEAFAAAHTRARAALRSARPLPERAHATLPVGYGRELTRILAGATAALPVVLVWNLAVLSLGSMLLRGVVPPLLLGALGTAYVIAAAGWLALLYGSIPFVAHGQVQRRLQEVTS